MLRVVVCVSGGGTNLQAIIDGIAQGAVCQTEIVRVISNNPGAYALERAKQAGIEGVCVSPKDYENRSLFEAALLQCVKEAAPDLIVLAGFMVKAPDEMVRQFENRIINIHPSLIPAFCGTGYYGLRVHEAALARGVKITGATVHFVNDGMDTGPIIMQKAVKVRDGDTPETLQKRVMEEAEWVLLPWCINLIAAGQIRVENGRVTIAE
ncbi:MAG: phosphoribosylglycinamide formyltransferase [Lachnospiraceae bacterium]|nr:phosphoribosylglycinamide formyltransferase [Lachnospiraceae bacterium]